MKILVLFDGAGLARLGLEQAGHECLGIEIDPIKHHLSKLVGSGNTELGNVLKMDVDYYIEQGYTGMWASPPCQMRSMASSNRHNQYRIDDADHLLNYSISLSKRFQVSWIENVPTFQHERNRFGNIYNAAQFTETPLQNRNRIIGGNYPPPMVFRRYQRIYKGVCPAILASEHHGSMNDNRRACKFYGRKLTLNQCCHHQGFQMPEQWLSIPRWFKGTRNDWIVHLYQAVGNGVPIYMAKAFGEAAMTNRNDDFHCFVKPK